MCCCMEHWTAAAARVGHCYRSVPPVVDGSQISGGVVIRQHHVSCYVLASEELRKSFNLF